MKILNDACYVYTYKSVHLTLWLNQLLREESVHIPEGYFTDAEIRFSLLSHATPLLGFNNDNNSLTEQLPVSARHGASLPRQVPNGRKAHETTSTDARVFHLYP